MHTDNEINKLRGNAGVGEKPRKRGRGRDDEERHRRALGGVDKDIKEIGPLQLAVDEHARDEGPHDRDGRGLRRGEQAGVNAAEDDDGQHQRGNGLEEADAEFLEVEVDLIFRPLLLVCKDNDHNHQNDHDADADAHTGLEHIADGGAGDRCVNDHDDTRRNDGAEAAGNDQKAGRAVAGIAHADHVAVEHRADSDDRCGRGAGERGEERAGQNQRQRHAAAHAADDGACKLADAAGNSALGHQVARKDKERDGHDGGGVQTAENTLGNGVDGNGDVRAAGNGGHRGHAERQCNGDAEDQKQRKAAEHQ